ncbi:MAG: TRAP transporter small permease subunit [Pseudomonadota bacterium]|jgi:TRAP-type mannitol/chloroaromatic compound transport system permease small subunit
MLERIASGIDAAIDALGRAVSWLTLAVVLLTFGVVVLRYAFDQGSIALQDLVLWLHGAVFLVGASYALRHDAHVRVDILYQRWSPRGRALADLVGTLVFLLPFCVLLVWVSADYVASSWAVREGSKDAGGLPGVFLVKTLIPACGVLLGVQGIALALRKLAVLRGGAGAPTQGHPERL